MRYGAPWHTINAVVFETQMYILWLPRMCTVSETTLECFAQNREYYGMVFWTAGQRIDPTRNSTFIWRVTSSDESSDTTYAMTFTNWEPNQPSYWRQEESCMHFSSGQSYQWNDAPCWSTMCSVCELDMWLDICTAMPINNAYTLSGKCVTQKVRYHRRSQDWKLDVAKMDEWNEWPIKHFWFYLYGFKIKGLCILKCL